MSTVQSVIDGGIAKCAAARPESFQSATELVSAVGMALRACFQVLARENPYVIGTSTPVGFNGTGWPRPATCIRMIRVQADAGTVAIPSLSVGARITVVPYDDQAVAAGVACLTELGQVFIPTGQSMDPVAGTVTMIYASAPTMPTQVGDTIDARFPDVFDDFLQWAVSAYLAQKDQREQDQVMSLNNQNAVLQQIIDWSRAQTLQIVQRFPILTVPLTNTAAGRQQPREPKE